MLKRFFAQFTEVPTVGLHAATAALIAMIYTAVLLGGVVLGRPISNDVAITVGTFILGYLTKTSYDFQTKRKTELVTPPDVMAQNAEAPQIAMLPADLSQALDGSLQPRTPRPVPQPMPDPTPTPAPQAPHPVPQPMPQTAPLLADG